MIDLERAGIRTTLKEEPIVDLEHLLPAHLRPTRSQLEVYKTQNEWLLSPTAEMGSDHSIDHPARVLIMQEYITRYLLLHGYDLSEDTRSALRWFAAIHDSRRYDDGFDLEHGERAAQFALTNLAHLMSPDTLQELIYLCRAHVPHDHEQPPLTLAGLIAKDADMLDRGRGCNDLDRSYVRLPITHLLISHARELHALSLEMNTGDQYKNVMQAAIQLGYVMDI
jgi:hypothetical protein